MPQTSHDSESPYSGLKPTATKPRQRSIQRWLTVGMCLVVAVTVLAGGLPGIGLIWWQVQRQVHSRMASRQAATMALIGFEQRGLAQIIELVAERPTLCELISAGDAPALGAYLEGIRVATALHALGVVLHDGQVIAAGLTNLTPDTLPPLSNPVLADIVLLDGAPRLAIYAAGSVDSGDGCTVRGTPRVFGLRLLDDTFMVELAEGTELSQSLIVDGYRIASNIGAAAAREPIDTGAAERLVASGEACCITVEIDGGTHYVGLTPIADRHGRLLALSEVALPAEEIRSGVLGPIALLLAIGLAMALAGTGATVLLTRSITQPLSRLADAAERMRAGDFDAAIPVDSGWTAIDRLAYQLDRSRQELQKSRQLARKGLSRVVRLLSAIREGVVTLTADGTISWINSDACAMLGYDRNSLLGRHYAQVFRPAPGETVTLKHALVPGPDVPVPDCISVLDSANRPVTLSVMVSWIDSGSSDLLERRKDQLLVLRDVSEEHAANRLRSEFMANVAHEFRTPLSAITAAAELLVDEPRKMTPDDYAELARTIQLSSLHLQSIVENVLESAIIEAGVFRVRRRPMRLSDTLAEASEMISPLLQRRGQRLVVNTDAEDAHLDADPDRLRQALLNLLQNAGKFGPVGSVIELRASVDGDAICFSVLDSGPGLASDRFGDLFNRFVTSGPTGGSQYGIGLGLSIVKAVAEAHGGCVGAENRLEGGARVWFRLPFGRDFERGETDDPNSGRGR